MQKNVVIILLAGLVAFLPGCRKAEEVAAAGARPHFSNPKRDMRQVARILLVEPANLSSNPQVSADFTNNLSRAIERKSLFGQTVIYRKEPAFRKYQLDYEKSPLDTLKEVYKAFGCDAILTGTIRDYQTYPRLAISVRLRLIDLTDGELIWAMEQVWDTTDKELEKRMRGFFDTEMRGGYEPLNWKMGLVSPNVFLKFVCYEVGETLSSSNDGTNAVYRQDGSGTSR
jgi:TolB-like protein